MLGAFTAFTASASSRGVTVNASNLKGYSRACAAGGMGYFPDKRTRRKAQMYPDEASARVYLESRLWPNGVTCPECKGVERITVRNTTRQWR